MCFSMDVSKYEGKNMVIYFILLNKIAFCGSSINGFQQHTVTEKKLFRIKLLSSVGILQGHINEHTFRWSLSNQTTLLTVTKYNGYGIK